MIMRWCFWSHLVFPCTNGHQNKPMFCCLCLWGGAFTCILYFNVQTGTKTNLFLVVYVYEVVLLLASCTSMYKQAPNKPIFSCLCLRGGAFSRILSFRVQAGTKNKPFFSCLCLGVVLLVAFCTSVYKQAPKTNQFLVVYVYGVVL